ncbi:MAG: hypothetical protein RSF68_05125 [Myroides sp.]
MKKLQNIAKILMVISVFIGLNACDANDDSNPTPSAKNVTAESLNGYYVPYQDETEEGNQRYRVIYFVKEDGTMKAYLDGAGTRRIAPLIVNDNKFIFDSNADGSVIFNFNFSADGNGKISLTSLTKSGTSVLIHYEMFSASQTPSWGGFTFERSAGVSNFIKYYSFSSNRTLFANSMTSNTEPNQGCYEIGNSIGFKSNSESLMGIFVPSWKGDTSVKMLLMHQDISTVALYKYHN